LIAPENFLKSNPTRSAWPVNMASLNLSANGPSISKSYQSVVDYPVSESARGSPTFAKWAIFSVSTPLVSSFQQDAGSKESVLKVQDSGGRLFVPPKYTAGVC
jgi:hypothetical protein